MINHRQLALLACVDSHESPAIRVKSDFSGVSVVGVGEGDEVWLCSSGHKTRLPDGLSSFPHQDGIKQFTIQKVAGSKPLPTTVEILRGS